MGLARDFCDRRVGGTASMRDSELINRTKVWLEKFVIGLNICPFARTEYIQNKIRYRESEALHDEACLQELLSEFALLDTSPDIATTLLVYPSRYSDFESYLDHVYTCEEILAQAGYEGIYQIASFHPDYQFAGCDIDDPANSTNRSPAPMIHLLREGDLSKAIDSHKDTHEIPARNQALCRSMGSEAIAKLSDED